MQCMRHRISKMPIKTNETTKLVTTTYVVYMTVYEMSFTGFFSSSSSPRACVCARVQATHCQLSKLYVWKPFGRLHSLSGYISLALWSHCDADCWHHLDAIPIVWRPLFGMLHSVRTFAMKFSRKWTRFLLPFHVWIGGEDFFFVSVHENSILHCLLDGVTRVEMRSIIFVFFSESIASNLIGLNGVNLPTPMTILMSTKSVCRSRIGAHRFEIRISGQMMMVNSITINRHYTLSMWTR